MIPNMETFTSSDDPLDQEIAAREADVARGQASISEAESHLLKLKQDLEIVTVEVRTLRRASKLRPSTTSYGVATPADASPPGPRAQASPIAIAPPGPRPQASTNDIAPPAPRPFAAPQDIAPAAPRSFSSPQDIAPPAPQQAGRFRDVVDQIRAGR